MAALAFLFAKVHEYRDEAATAAIAGTAFTIPYWRDWLATFSEGLSFAGQVLAVALTVYKLWDAYRAAKGRTDAAMGVASAMGVAAKKGSLASGSLLTIAAAFLGVFAIGSWLASTRAHADPATPARLVGSGSTTSSRKRTKDDAGEEGSDEAPLEVDGAPAWFNAGLKLQGTEEKKGRRSNPVVLKMFADVGHEEITNTDTPWCAAYVGAMLERSGIKCTKALTARSYLKWGVELEDPRPGCIVVMWRGARDDGFSGHIGFFVREEGEFIWMLGGNQGDAVSVAKFRKSKILAYRWPRSLVHSGTMQGAVIAKAAAVGTGGTLAEVAATLPPDPPKPVTEHAAEAARTVGGQLEVVRDALPTGSRLAIYIGIACCVLTVIGTSLVMYNRWQLRNDTGR